MVPDALPGGSWWPGGATFQISNLIIILMKLSLSKGAFTYYVTHFLPFLTHVYSQVTHSDIFLYHV